MVPAVWILHRAGADRMGLESTDGRIGDGGSFGMVLVIACPFFSSFA